MTRHLRTALIALVAFLFFVLPGAATFLTDLAWFDETGYRSVFIRELTTRAGLWAAGWAVAFAWLAVHLRIALRSVPLHPVLWTGQGGVEVRMPGREAFGRLVLGAAALVGVPFGFYAAAQWLTWLMFRQAEPFGAVDPLLGYEVATHVFVLPVLEFVRTFLTGLVLLALAGAVAVYVFAGRVGLSPHEGVFVRRDALRHLSLLAAVLFVVLAYGAWLDVPATLVSPSGIIQGASYTDVAARIPAARLLAVAALAGAVLAVVAAARSLTFLVAAAVLYGVVALGGQIWAAAVQRFVVAPNEQVRETPYIVHNIAATQTAFGLADVDDRELSGDAQLTRADIERNAATLKNVRLWDHRPLLDTFGQLQEIRPYYDFVSVDNDRYVINGEYRQIMLSARELNSAALPNRTWVNERLAFTHGYGVTLGPVNQVTQEGLPVLFVKDLPPVSGVDLDVAEPSLYYGELSNDYVFVNTRATEFHYPRGEDNVTTRYEGRGGVPVDSLWRKVLFALRFRSQQILFSNDLTAGSRVLFHRRIDERVRRIAPFLQYDRDPYLVVADGRLFWIQDAYTITDRYPYSTTAVAGVNYIRNSVKVVVDAYHGTTTYYLADPADPLARTLDRAFPGLLRPYGEMPPSLRAHVRYPETIFALQTAIYSTYHMTNPEVFYNKEDQWEIPTIEGGGQAEPMQPYYTIMKMPGETEAEFIQMVPLTPRRKDNLAAWMVARSDGEHYGKLLVFRFPKQKVVYGPRQVVARISQDQVISPQITLWNQQGSEVIQGTLLVIPIEESLLYIRPLYLRAQGGRIPELKRVIVAYQNAIVMEPTLDEALARLFGPGRATDAAPAAAPAAAPPAPGTPPPAPGAPSDQAALIAQARQHYQRAIQAQREGDWARYGEELRQLGEVLSRLEGARR